MRFLRELHQAFHDDDTKKLARWSSMIYVAWLFCAWCEWYENGNIVEPMLGVLIMTVVLIGGIVHTHRLFKRIAEEDELEELCFRIEVEALGFSWEFIQEWRKNDLEAERLARKRAPFKKKLWWFIVGI